MSAFVEEITHYLTRYRAGNADEAFHGLLELDHEALPELEGRFRTSTDPGLRAFLLRVIWQHRQQSVIPVLAHALLDADRRVWREAMDGLVALGCPAAVTALRTVRAQRDEQDFQGWADEAIEQAEMEAQ
jgi:hypothetical protein